MNNPRLNKIKEKVYQSRPYNIYHFKRNRLKLSNLIPNLKPFCDILKSKEQYENASKEVENLKLNWQDFNSLEKKWDNLAALSIILRNTKKDARILDAGGEYYSAILHWLKLYGYRKLNCINISFKEKSFKGPITYEKGNITKTNFKENYFNIITCLSVIEHGVNIELFLKEASRILSPKGLLIISTDYWNKPINTKNKICFGVPVKIFTKKEILNIIETAKKYNLKLIGDLRLDCKEKVINWNELKYTFIYFTFQKV